MPRRPSAPASAAASAALVQLGEPLQVSTGSQHASSQLTIEFSANRYQKVVGALAGRLKNRVGPVIACAAVVLTPASSFRATRDIR